MSSISTDMIRAFVVLADTLNLSQTATQLSTTRQTIRRHIDMLGELKGGPLFALDGHSYRLTRLGKSAVPEAQALLAALDAWSDPAALQTERQKFLERANMSDEAGRQFVSQQHPVSQVSRIGTDRIRRCLAGWGGSSAQLEAAAFKSIRNELVIYRRGRDGWICVSVGEDSAYASWFGADWAASAIGRLVDEDRAGDAFNRFIYGAYERVYVSGGVRYDHLKAHLPRPGYDALVEVTFQRLLLGCIFPDGSPALAVVVDITDDIEVGTQA